MNLVGNNGFAHADCHGCNSSVSQKANSCVSSARDRCVQFRRLVTSGVEPSASTVREFCLAVTNLQKRRLIARIETAYSRRMKVTGSRGYVTVDAQNHPKLGRIFWSLSPLER